MFPIKKSGKGDRCIIVGSGPTSAGFKAPSGVPIIAVNGAIEWINRASYWFTLDPSNANLERMANRRRGTQYFCALPDVEAGWDVDGKIYQFRREGYRGAEPLNKTSPEWWWWRWSAKLGLSEDPKIINSGNSAFGALGLAYHLGYRSVALIGVDGTQEPRHHDGGMPNNLSHLSLLFQSALHQINLTTLGGLEGIHKSTLAEWLLETK